MGHTVGSTFQALSLTYGRANSRIRLAKNNVLIGRLMGVLALVVIAAVACTSPAESGPGGAAPVESAIPTSLSVPDNAVEETAPSDPAATPEQSGTGVSDVQDLQRSAAASVQLDVDSFAEIKPGGPRDVDPRRFRQLIERDQIVPIYEPLIISPAETVTTPEELVMGVVLNGEARAYPVSQMRSREIANDELGGIPILVTW